MTTMEKTTTTTKTLNYRDRIAMLKERKNQQTLEKVRRIGPLDTDDHGYVLPPEDFTWEPIPNHPNGSFYGFKGWSENFSSLLETLPPYIDPADMLAGRYRMFLYWKRKTGWLPELEFPAWRKLHEKYGIISGIEGANHFAPDYRIGLELGWNGILEKIRRCRAQQGPEIEPEKCDFYDAEEKVALAIQNWIRRHIAAAREALAVESRPELQQNLREMIEVNEWVAENPPRTMREAVQWIAWFNMASRTYCGDGAGCQLDAMLLPYYERDIAEGRITDEDAILLIACLLLSDPHYYQIGGPDASGKDVTNHVSFLILEAAHLMGIPANLTVRVHDGLDRAFFLKSVEYLFKDKNAWPRYAGDKALTGGFMRNGYPAELARQRIAVGCHWFAIPGREYTLNDCVKINTAKVFSVAFDEMMEAARTEKVNPSADELFRRFEDHLRKAVRCTAEGLDFHLAHHKEVYPELTINLLCYGTLEKGLDASNGGVEFYNMCIDGCGLATVADSFAALQQRVEQEGAISWEDVGRYIDNDYAGLDGERTRLMMKNIHHYGYGNSLGDQWAVRVSKLFTRLVKEAPTPEGRNLIPGWFSWANTIGLGKATKATPNGRHAGAPISHGANPDPGFRQDGAPTAMSTAVASIQPTYGNTAPIQLELDPAITKEEGGVELVADLIKTHCDMGGSLFNINVLDAEKLRKAHKDPMLYPDLVVRVTGFTAYFAMLSTEFRQLVIDRMIDENN